MLKETQRLAFSWHIGGRVQGVGYRPFVARLACSLGLRGIVRNLGGEVLIEAEGDAKALQDFEQALQTQAPSAARPLMYSRHAISGKDWQDFEIAVSAASDMAEIHITPDLALCSDCRRELWDVQDRRFRYLFINCTQCGPRYTLLQQLPYDRANTSMADFALCAACQAEYADARQRRYHAEPIACPACGPLVQFRNAGSATTGEAALSQCIERLLAGDIIAVKGIGAYHLICVARDESIARLRVLKQRPHKPLAILFQDIAALERELVLNTVAEQALCSPVAPIVLLPRRADSMLPQNIAPDLPEVGGMLPYSPLHDLLIRGVGQPLVVTSANASGEPALINAQAVEEGLSHFDGFLHHNRDILRPAEDSVVRVIADSPRLLRAGRGHAPLEFTLPRPMSQPVLAVGGHMKNTIALAWEQRVVLSPHIGDLQSPRSLEIFEKTIADLQQLYGVNPQVIACDQHVGYASSHWAKKQNMLLHKVWHHHAHASALALEQDADKTWLTFTWDGVGLGEDGQLWGGEALYGRPGQWQRVASLRPFRLPGGGRASREPWRAAAGVCWELQLAQAFPGHDADLLHAAWRKELNAPVTTAVGRLFDAAAYLLGLIDCASFEGQGPMLLEAVASGEAEVLHIPIEQDAAGLWRADWSVLITALRRVEIPVAQRAMQFHQSLAELIVQITRQLHQEKHFDLVGLTGGVFQNKLLSELAMRQLQAAGFDAHLPCLAPCNDGALALGQVMECLQ